MNTSTALPAFLACQMSVTVSGQRVALMVELENLRCAAHKHVSARVVVHMCVSRLYAGGSTTEGQ